MTIFLDLLRPQGIDFPQYYDASVMFWHKLNMYQYLLSSPGPFNYPPSSFLFLFWPGLFAYQTAGVLWNLLSLVSFLIALYLVHKLAVSKVQLLAYFASILAFTLPFFPVKHNLASGQINAFILLFVVVSLYLYKTGHKNWSAVFLAYATGIKIIPAIFMLLYIINKDRKQVVRILLWLMVFCLIPLVFISPNFQLTYYAKDFFQGFPLAGKDLYYNQSLLGLLTRTFHQPFVIRSLQYTFSLLMLLLTWMHGRTRSVNRLISAVSCLYLMLHPLAWQHHFVVIVIPLVLLAYDFKQTKATTALWLVLLFAYFLSAANIKQPAFIAPQFGFLLSHQFFAALILWILALWKDKFFRISSYVWVGTILFAYFQLILCRSNICL